MLYTSVAPVLTPCLVMQARWSVCSSHLLDWKKYRKEINILNTGSHRYALLAPEGLLPNPRDQVPGRGSGWVISSQSHSIMAHKRLKTTDLAISWEPQPCIKLETSEAEKRGIYNQHPDARVLLLQLMFKPWAGRAPHPFFQSGIFLPSARTRSHPAVSPWPASSLQREPRRHQP